MTASQLAATYNDRLVQLDREAVNDPNHFVVPWDELSDAERVAQVAIFQSLIDDGSIIEPDSIKKAESFAPDQDECCTECGPEPGIEGDLASDLLGDDLDTVVISISVTAPPVILTQFIAE